MIDLALSKIAIIGVVALVVIGPERLPKVARMAGTLYGRAQRYLHEVKTEVSREIEMEELRNLQKEVQESAHQFKSDIESTVADNLGEVHAAWKATPAWTPPQATMSDVERKAREFRRKKLVRNSAVPGWYKKQHGGRTHVISGAARVKRFRPRASNKASFF
ncbi:MAG TPA: Sec-independent protein translocase protein TatB [Telluria sp.]|nr:Sec-independent protein translocase protein TatB [Telluria sp.]